MRTRGEQQRALRMLCASPERGRPRSLGGRCPAAESYGRSPLTLRRGPDALRADLGPTGCGSTESRCLLSVRAPPGSHLPDRAGTFPRRGANPGPGSQWRAPVRHLTPDPAAPRRPRGSSSVGCPVVDPAEPTRHPPSTVNHRLTCEDSRRRRGGGGGNAGRAGIAADHDHPAVGPGDHSPGRTKTVCPPTTVRRQMGSSAPGVRSGRPGVPERGSVDQRATRSSGVWTTSSPVRHTA